MTKFNIKQNEQEVNKNISKILNPINKEKREIKQRNKEISNLIEDIRR